MLIWLKDEDDVSAEDLRADLEVGASDPLFRHTPWVLAVIAMSLVVVWTRAPEQSCGGGDGSTEIRAIEAAQERWDILLAIAAGMMGLALLVALTDAVVGASGRSRAGRIGVVAAILGAGMVGWIVGVFDAISRSCALY